MAEKKKFVIVPIVETAVTGFEKVPVYSFDELPKDVQQSLINNFNREGLQEDFFDGIVDLYTDGIMDDIANKYNLNVFSINYDLSYCQGSGATFITGEITGTELKNFIKKTIPGFVKYFRFPNVLFPYFCECVKVIFLPGRCANYNNVGTYGDFNPDEEQHIDNYLTDKLYQLEKLLEIFSSGLSCEITEKLYNEYEAYTSDENIKKVLSERGDYWTEDGEPIDANDVKEVATDV